MDRRKQDLLDYMQMQGFLKKDAEKFTEALCRYAADCLRDGDDVYLRRFGAFKVREIPAKTWTIGGRETEVPAHATVRFYPSKSLREYINGNTDL